MEKAQNSKILVTHLKPLLRKLTHCKQTFFGHTNLSVSNVLVTFNETLLKKFNLY